MSLIKVKGNASGTGVFTIESPATNTDRTLTLPDNAGTVLTSASDLDATKLTGSLPAISGASITNLNASNLASGTVATARLGSGTANNTTYLRGDQTWATVSTTPTTTQVLDATAGASAGAVGTYAFAGTNTTNTAHSWGGTIAGSSLRASGILAPNDTWTNTTGFSISGVGSSTSLSGTWRAMGNQAVANQGGSLMLWLRIS